VKWVWQGRRRWEDGSGEGSIVEVGGAGQREVGEICVGMIGIGELLEKVK